MRRVAQARNPIIRWEWIIDEWDQISEALVQHLVLTVASVALGVIVAALLSIIALRYRFMSRPSPVLPASSTRSQVLRSLVSSSRTSG